MEGRLTVTALFLLTTIMNVDSVTVEDGLMVCEDDPTGASGSALLQMKRRHSPVKEVNKETAGEQFPVLKEDHTSSDQVVKEKPDEEVANEGLATPSPTIQQMIQEGFDSSVSTPWGHLPAKQAYRQNGQLSGFNRRSAPSGHRHQPKPGLHGSVSNQRCGLQALIEASKAHLNDSRACLPAELPLKHIAAIRSGVSLLGHLLPTDPKTLQLLALSREAVPAAASSDQPEVDGTSATLDAAGFRAVTSRCCPQDMEIFVQRLLESMNLDVCSKPHVQGLMHWFSCVPDMDFQYLVDVINNGNPCKYWTAKGSACPLLSAECEGEWCR